MKIDLPGLCRLAPFLASCWGGQIAFADAFNDGLVAYRNGVFERAAGLWLSEEPTSSDPRLFFGLGMLYAHGKGLKLNPAKAVAYFRTAAEGGYAPAQFNLGLAYLTGEGIDRNGQEARNWWEKAALQGFVPAQRDLASLLWSGDGVERDQAAALYWFRQAALGGNPEAVSFLQSLFQGMVLQPFPNDTQTETVSLSPFIRGELAFEQKQFERAHQLWLPLADDGDADAQYYIGYLLESGQGVQQDMEGAAVMYESAAGQGQAQAQYNLGILYINGQGVQQNEGLGLYWIQSAADSNEPRAKAYMESLR